jgi:glutathione S-transferase
VGNRFSVADIITGALLTWAERLELLTTLPNARAYSQRVKARPAWQKAMAD